MLNRRTTSTHALREKAISEFHDLLAADETLSPVVLEKLRSAIRKKRLLYGERSIGVALRPHLLHHNQFQRLSEAAQRVTSALEKIAAAVVEDPRLMGELGLTEAERRMALVEPGFSTAGVTTRLDAFLRGDEIKFVESNAENPSSLSDQEEFNRVLLELPVMTNFAERYRLRQFSPVERLLETLLGTYREWGGIGVPNVSIGKTYRRRVSSFCCKSISARKAFPPSSVRRMTSSMSKGNFDAARFASISSTSE